MESNRTDAPPDGKKPSWRSEHRSRSHESAHAEAALAEMDVPPDVPLAPMGPPTLVSDDRQLEKLVGELREDGSFAYDSEFIGELTYFPKLCVLQVASQRRVALIDPLSPIDLTPFWELLADPSVEKIVHAGEQDLEPVSRQIGRPPANFFDTQIAAGFVGLPYPLSLSKLVLELTGAKLGKGLTFSHWDQRPLSPIQVRYAADDVRYLPAVRAKIGNRLAALGHAPWAAEECAALCASSQSRFDPESQYLKIRGASSLAPRNLAVLRDLMIWRDESARQQDLPPRTFLRDEVLLDLARTPVKAADKLARVRGLPRPVERDFGARIVEITNQAWSLPADALPPASKDTELSPTERFRADALFTTTQCACAGMSIDPALVVSRQEFGEFYRHITGAVQGELPRLLQGWRGQAVGERIQRLVKGEGRADIQWKDDRLQLTWQ